MQQKLRFFLKKIASTHTLSERAPAVAVVLWGFIHGMLQVAVSKQNMLGLNEATLVGAPHTMLVGRFEDLREPDAVIIDRAG